MEINNKMKKGYLQNLQNSSIISCLLALRASKKVIVPSTLEKAILIGIEFLLKPITAIMGRLSSCRTSNCESLSSKTSTSSENDLIPLDLKAVALNRLKLYSKLKFSINKIKRAPIIELGRNPYWYNYSNCSLPITYFNSIWIMIQILKNKIIYTIFFQLIYIFYKLLLAHSTLDLI